MELKKTALYQKHLNLRAKIVDFHGWALPLEYKSMLEEAKAVRQSCGIFDASHMGEIIISGDKACEFLQSMVTNDISSLGSNQMQYNLFLDDSGHIIDDCMVYHKGDSFLCVVNASNIDKVLTWLNKQNCQGVSIKDASQDFCLITIQGPESAKVIDKIFPGLSKDLTYMTFKGLDFKGQEVLISRSGYTAEDGFEIYLRPQSASELWDTILEIGSEFNLTACGLGARDILRIEAGYPLYGYEIDDKMDPLTAGLSWAVKFNKEFMGKSALLKLKEAKIKNKRVGFLMLKRAVARYGYKIYYQDKPIGSVTSGTFSPNKQAFIGMASILKEAAVLDREIEIEIRNNKYKAKIVKFPFINPKVKTKKILKEVSNGESKV